MAQRFIHYRTEVPQCQLLRARAEAVALDHSATHTRGLHHQAIRVGVRAGPRGELDRDAVVQRPNLWSTTLLPPRPSGDGSYVQPSHERGGTHHPAAGNLGPQVPLRHARRTFVCCEMWKIS